jgi:hypothetical protein
LKVVLDFIGHEEPTKRHSKTYKGVYEDIDYENAREAKGATLNPRFSLERYS